MADLPPLATPLRKFFKRVGIGPTKGYAEVNAGRIKVRKIGNRSVVLEEDGRAYVENLPALKPTKAA